MQTNNFEPTSSMTYTTPEPKGSWALFWSRDFLFAQFRGCRDTRAVPQGQDRATSTAIPRVPLLTRDQWYRLKTNPGLYSLSLFSLYAELVIFIFKSKTCYALKSQPIKWTLETPTAQSCCKRRLLSKQRIRFPNTNRAAPPGTNPTDCPRLITTQGLPLLVALGTSQLLNQHKALATMSVSTTQGERVHFWRTFKLKQYLNMQQDFFSSSNLNLTQ